MEKIKPSWQERYAIKCFALLTVFGIHAFTENKPNNLERTTIQEEIKQDSIPQVTNYEFDNRVGPVWKDPISNVYPSEQ